VLASQYFVSISGLGKMAGNPKKEGLKVAGEPFFGSHLKGVDYHQNEL
jgi:hypothetical protein